MGIGTRARRWPISVAAPGGRRGSRGGTIRSGEREAAREMGIVCGAEGGIERERLDRGIGLGLTRFRWAAGMVGPAWWEAQVASWAAGLSALSLS